MKKPFLITLFAILLFSKISALENQSIGARSKALSNAYISVSDIWSSFHNQAGLSLINTATAGVFFESRFMVEELSLSAATIALPVKAGTFAFNFYQFGKGSFKENKLGIAFAKHLSDKLCAGIQLDYLSTRFPENRHSSGFATFEAGFIYQASKTLFLGVHVFNPIPGGFETLQEKQIVPAVFRIGGHYCFDKSVMLFFESQKTAHSPLCIKTGIEFLPVENLALRFGVSGKPLNYTSGIGYKYKKVTTDIGFSYHGNLGITPSIAIQFEL